MELSKKMQDALNDQIREELYSSYLYLSMASYCQSINLPGFAHWMKVQSEEEYEHGMKFFEYIQDRGGAVSLGAIAAPPIEWSSPAELVAEVLTHEQKVTRLINAIYAQALKENDYPTQVMLHWFIAEQVEEESNAGSIVEMLRMVGEQPQGLFQVDRVLAGRSGA